MILLISGGAKSGKTALAQRLIRTLAGSAPHYYVATTVPCDDEDRRRVARHIADRAGMGFVTLECGRDICACLKGADPRGAFLLDSTTALLMNEMFPSEAGFAMDVRAPERCARQLTEFVRSVAHAVVVSDSIYADPICYDPQTEAYRRGLALIDRQLAAVSHVVVEAAAGNFILHKGVMPI